VEVEENINVKHHIHHQVHDRHVKFGGRELIQMRKDAVIHHCAKRKKESAHTSNVPCSAASFPGTKIIFE